MGAKTTPFAGAVTLAPLGGGLVGALAATLTAMAIYGIGGVEIAIIFGVVIFVPTAFVCTLIFGIPWHMLLQQRRLTNSALYWVAGALVGLAIPWMVALHNGHLPLLGENPSDTDPRIELEQGIMTCSIASALGALSGAATGWFAWLIRRPDRDANPATPTP